MQLTLRDQTNGRLGEGALVVEFGNTMRLTARTLIAERVRLEWEAQREKSGAAGRKPRQEQCAGVGRDRPPPLVDADMMRRLNPYSRPRGARPVLRTLEAATKLAFEGFRRNAFFLIVDGRQVTDLDEEIPFQTTSRVVFLRLFPLVGG
ncbi:MAG: hypothetical protein IRZ04_09215 [Rhodospirillales bacterium]|nr:hypothetical protein [Rhodospirillales bacterium]